MSPRQQKRWERRKAQYLKALQLWLEDIERRAIRWEDQKMDFLAGKKTYLSAAGIGLVTVLYALGMLDDKTYQVLLGLLGGTGLAALRAGISK